MKKRADQSDEQAVEGLLSALNRLERTRLPALKSRTASRASLASDKQGRARSSKRRDVVSAARFDLQNNNTEKPAGKMKGSRSVPSLSREPSLRVLRRKPSAHTLKADPENVKEQNGDDGKRKKKQPQQQQQQGAFLSPTAPPGRLPPLGGDGAFSTPLPPVAAPFGSSTAAAASYDPWAAIMQQNLAQAQMQANFWAAALWQQQQHHLATAAGAAGAGTYLSAPGTVFYSVPPSFPGCYGHFAPPSYAPLPY